MKNMLTQFIRHFQRKSATASVAKERLHIVVSHERSRRNGPDYLPLLQRKILDVVAEYMLVEREQVNVNIERTENSATLALNITLPEYPREQATHSL